jgi:hypothetical protein
MILIHPLLVLFPPLFILGLIYEKSTKEDY